MVETDMKLILCFSNKKSAIRVSKKESNERDEKRKRRELGSHKDEKKNERECFGQGCVTIYEQEKDCKVFSTRLHNNP